MKKHPVVLSKRAVRDVGIEPAAPIVPDSFLSFRYSYTEISATGARACVKSRTARYENGKLAAESFEGDLDRHAYERIVGEAHRRFAEQAALVLRGFLSFLSPPGKTSSERD